MQVKIKRLSEKAVVPRYARPGDAGMDLVATSIIGECSEHITYGTDLSIEIPEGYVGLIFPRSSIRQYELVLSNSVGVIDSGYRGEIMATFFKTESPRLIEKVYKVGERIAQLIILPYPTIEMVVTGELSDTERGARGFGSTGS